jgi:hypothetical protein
MALAHCILGKVLGVGCHCFPPPLDVPTISARCLHVQRRERPLAAQGGTLRGREMFRQISSRIDFHVILGIFYMPQICDMGTDGFTSPSKEGVMRIFLPLKIRRLRPGLNPRWVIYSVNKSKRIPSIFNDESTGHIYMSHVNKVQLIRVKMICVAVIRAFQPVVVQKMWMWNVRFILYCLAYSAFLCFLTSSMPVSAILVTRHGFNMIL